MLSSRGKTFFFFFLIKDCSHQETSRLCSVSPCTASENSCISLSWAVMQHFYLPALTCHNVCGGDALSTSYLMTLIVIFRNKCKGSHSLASPYNAEILKRYDLHDLTEKQLFQLLLQNDPYLLPEVRLTATNGRCRWKFRMYYKFQTIILL